MARYHITYIIYIIYKNLRWFIWMYYAFLITICYLTLYDVIKYGCVEWFLKCAVSMFDLIYILANFGDISTFEKKFWMRIFAELGENFLIHIIFLSGCFYFGFTWSRIQKLSKAQLLDRNIPCTKLKDHRVLRYSKLVLRLLFIWKKKTKTCLLRQQPEFSTIFTLQCQYASYLSSHV